MSKAKKEEAATAMADFIVIPSIILMGLYILASIFEAILNPNIEPFKQIFVAISGTPIFVFYLKEKLTE